MKTTITALCNQKGGVGKTTSCLNLGVGLAQEGKKVLLVDCDPQGSLTISTGRAQPDSLQDTLSTAMLAKMMDTPYDVSRAILRHGQCAGSCIQRCDSRTGSISFCERLGAAAWHDCEGAQAD